VYRLHVMNVSEVPRRYALTVTGLPGIDMMGERIVALPPATDKTFTIQVRVPPESGKQGANKIYFDVKSLAEEKIAVHEPATFLVP